MLRLREAIEFPVRCPGWAKKLAIGGALSALPALVFTLLGYVDAVDILKSSLISAPLGLLYFLIWGYAFYIFRAAYHQEEPQLLAWGRWADLFCRGLVIFVIQMAYGLLPLLLMAIGIGVLYRGGWWLFTGLLLLMIGMLIFLLVAFFFPMGIGQYARWNRIEAAFYFPSLLRAIRYVLVEYVALFLSSLAVLLALGFIATIPYLGPVLATFLSFYLALVSAKLFGEVCGMARGEA
jgi:hypothetical protein